MNPAMFFSIFTQKKSFAHNSFIGNIKANQLGLHQYRVQFAHFMTNLRRNMLLFCLPKNERDFFNQNGYVLVENFLPQDDFTLLQKTVKNIEHFVRICTQGDTHTYRVLFTSELYKHYPELQILKYNKYLKRLFQYTGAAGHAPTLYGECIYNGVDANCTKTDPQKNLHSDTFFPTVKAWLYLDDVSDMNGAFHYVEGSHKLTPQRLKWEYDMSLKATNSTDSYTKKGSFRVEENELSTLNLPQAKAFRVPKNTLLLADTYGFHKRGQAEAGSTRSSIFMLDRANPFLPLSRWDFDFMPQLRAAYIENSMAKNEKAMLAQNKKPIWRSAGLGIKLSPQI
jgi:hypothetical protein